MALCQLQWKQQQQPKQNKINQIENAKCCDVRLLYIYIKICIFNRR